jgi:hypothetical protein
VTPEAAVWHHQAAWAQPVAEASPHREAEEEWARPAAEASPHRGAAAWPRQEAEEA